MKQNAKSKDCVQKEQTEADKHTEVKTQLEPTGSSSTSHAMGSAEQEKSHINSTNETDETSRMVERTASDSADTGEKIQRIPCSSSLDHPSHDQQGNDERCHKSSLSSAMVDGESDDCPPIEAAAPCDSETQHEASHTPQNLKLDDSTGESYSLPAGLDSTTSNSQDHSETPLSIEMLDAQTFDPDGFHQPSGANPSFNLLSPANITSAPSSVISNGSSREPGVDSFRRFVRSRASARTRTTAGSSSSQRSTHSLGDEDLFDLEDNGEDPRLPIDLSEGEQPQRRASWDVAQMQQPNENFPPIVWEGEEFSDTEEGRESRRRNSTETQQHGNPLRGFLPGVRRRGGRQSSSVRRHLPGSSPSSSGTSILAASPLSTTAAAVLFTSSQASIDSNNDYSNRRRRMGQARAASASTLDESAMAVGTSQRSTAVDVGGGDALSISTVGYSTMARSEAAGLGESSVRQSFGNTGEDAPERQEAGGEEPAENNRTGGRITAANPTDPNREARIRWVRINQRFQLTITCVAILFSFLLFSILISWIVLTSAYVVTFEKSCDVPLKFFYWMVTLQLVLDVFRNDIMRYVLLWDPAAHPPGRQHQTLPARVVAYNIAYLAYALLVLRLGVTCVYIEGQHAGSTCRHTAPELFQSSLVFVTLTLAAWATIILGYLVPFCVVAALLTWNGYNPGEDDNGTRMTPGVFPGAYSSAGAPPGTIDQLRQVDFGDCDENCPQECCICMEDFGADDAIVVVCDSGHILHKDCCSMWLRQARTCPVCRTDIPNAQAAERTQELNTEQQDPDPSENPQQNELEQLQLHLPNPVPVPVHRRAAVSPQLPFRPAGRNEVATLIRAFRQPRQGGDTNTNRRPSGSQGSRPRSNQEHSESSTGASRTGENQDSVGIEITVRSQHSNAAGMVEASETSLTPVSLPTPIINDEEAQFNA